MWEVMKMMKVGFCLTLPMTHVVVAKEYVVVSGN